jgi:hypothetical protein
VAESRLDIFIRLRDQISAGLKNIKRSTDEVVKSTKELDKQDTKSLQSQYDKLEKEINDVKTASERVTSQLATVRKVGLAIAGIGAAIAAPFLIGLRAASQFSVQIAEVGTLVNDAVLTTFLVSLALTVLT